MLLLVHIFRPGRRRPRNEQNGEVNEEGEEEGQGEEEEEGEEEYGRQEETQPSESGDTESTEEERRQEDQEIIERGTKAKFYYPIDYYIALLSRARIVYARDMVVILSTCIRERDIVIAPLVRVCVCVCVCVSVCVSPLNS